MRIKETGEKPMGKVPLKVVWAGMDRVGSGHYSDVSGGKVATKGQ